MRNLSPTAWMLFLLIFVLTGFSRDWDPGTSYTPLLIKKTDLPKSVFMQTAREFQNPGKIYLYGQTIYIVDKYTGIHVIDNQNPSQPTQTGFIHIAGVMDVAIRDSVMYADNAIDLVAISLKNYPQIEVIQRVADVFPEPIPPDTGWTPYRYSAGNRPPNTVIVGWYK